MRRFKTSIACKLAFALACASLLAAAVPGVESAAAQGRDQRPGQLWSQFPAGEERLQAQPKAQARAPVRERLIDRSPPPQQTSDRRPSIALVLGMSAVTGVLLLVLLPVALGTRVLVRAEKRFTPERNGAAPATHLLLFPTTDGYVLAERSGEAPGAGTAVDGRFAVTRVGPSPLPLDRRRCAYLEEL